MPDVPALTSVYLFVKDIEASLAFYEQLGLSTDDRSGDFARIQMPNGLTIEMGTAAVTRRYDPSFQEPAGGATNTLNFDLAAPEAVDAMYAKLTAAGYHGHLAPIDAFWRARFAIVDDPDGNVIGLHGPRGA